MNWSWCNIAQKNSYRDNLSIIQNQNVSREKFQIESPALLGRNLLWKVWGRTWRESEYYMPTSVTIISDSAFSFCTKLRSITTPKSITTIGNQAFYKCFELESIDLPPNITSIGKYAFYNCFELKLIRIPAQVMSIGDSPFRKCCHLRAIEVDMTNSWYISIDGILFTKNYETHLCFPAKDYLSSYTIPQNVRAIGHSSFCYCSMLESITIPASVTSIGHFAIFSCDKLRFITISSSVTSIGDQAFSHCSNIQ